MNNHWSNWNRYTLTVNSARGPLELKWSDVESLAKFSALQTGAFGGAGKELTKQLFFENFPKWVQSQWQHHEYIVGSNIEESATVVDLGSGLGIIDLLQSQYTPGSKFYLVDRQENNFQQGIYYSDEYPFYNNWVSTIDCISSTGIDLKKFVMQDPDKELPEADVILSYFSWCFHYPKEVYWDRVLQSLKPGGRLVLDVRLLDHKDVIGEISEELKSTPHKDPIPNKIPDWIDNYPSPDPDIMGYRCVWVRQ